MANDLEDDDDKSLEEGFLSGDPIPNDIGDDDIIGGDGDASGFGDDDDDTIIDDDNQEDNEDEDNEDEEDEEGAEGKGGKDATADDPDGNEFFLRATYWKEIGRLPADMEIPKDIKDDVELEDLYLKAVEKNVVNRIQTDIKDAIKAKGIDPDEIFGGENEDEYYQKEYARIASIPYDVLVEKNDDVTKALKILTTEYWISKSKGTLDEEDVAVNVANDLNKMDEEELYAKLQKYFGAEAKRLEAKIKDDSKERVRQEAEQAKEDAKYVRETLKDKYTPEQAEKVILALTKKDQRYVDANGNQRVVTLFEKKRLEAGRDIKSQLALATKLILDVDETTIKEKSERVGSINTLQKLAKVPIAGKQVPGKNKAQTKNSIKSRELEEMLLD